MSAQTVGRYELHDEIAAGGMASVHLGRMLGGAGFSKVVAIKRLHSHLARDPELVERLLDEARLMERVRHPNVVATLDVVSEGDELLLVMEYVHGEPLWKLLRAANQAGGACPPEIVAAIVHDVLLGLSAAHNTTDAAGQPLCIVHRDVSPQNVMVGADGVARLVDFGIAKSMGSIGHTREGHLKGKVPYMAPEILQFEPASPQTDVWAVAVVAWEARCARRLFRGETEIEAWSQVLAGEIADPATVVGVGDPIDDVILRGLSRDVTERYATARAMADDIERRCRIASPTEVAAWVESLCADSLASRAALLRKVETSAPVASTPPPAASPSLPPPAPRSSARTIIPLLIAAAVLAFGVSFAAVRMRSATAVGPPMPPPSAPAASASTSTSTATSTPTLPSTSTSTSTSTSPSPSPSPPPSPSPSTHPKSVHSAHMRDAGAPAGSARPSDCDPPYFVDASGRTRFKLECVRNP